MAVTVDQVIIEGAATIGEIYHWATWAMPPPLIWTAKNPAYGQKCNLREVAPMEKITKIVATRCTRCQILRL